MEKSAPKPSVTSWVKGSAAADLTRRQVLSAMAAAPVAASPLQRAASRPNILFLMADQHRADCLSAEGHPAVRTPNMDRLGKEGIRFQSAYSSTPSCTPARACLLTGLSPWNHGMLGYSRVAEQYPVEMPQLMRSAGYYTMAIGKLHYSPQRNLHGYHAALLDESKRAESVDFRSDYRSWFYSEAPTLDPDATGIGFNDYKGGVYKLPERLHPTSWMGNCAVRFLENYQRPEPFFLKVSFARPHSPYDPPQRWMDKYQDASIPTPIQSAWSERYAERNTTARDDIWHGRVSPEETRRARQGYYGNVTFIDEQIGRILNVLETRGMLENTLIVYTSDHGDMTGDHNLWRKSYAYEASSRIPMLLRWPAGMIGAKRGQVSHDVVELRDLLPTFLDASGQSAPAKLDGMSLLNLARGQRGDWRSYLDLEHDVCYSPENHWNALTDGRMKYIFHARDGEEMLFDLSSDPAEKNNLAADPAHVRALQSWRGRMVAHLEVRGEPFVVNGKLGLRPKSTLHSPHYPRPKSA